MLLEGMHEHFGDATKELYANPKFLSTVFKAIAEFLYMVEGNDKVFRETVRLKLTALKDVIHSFLEK